MFAVSATLFAGTVALSSVSPPADSQIQNTAQEKAANLRAQLTEVETKQAELQTRLQKLEENLKPGNIEQNLAGIGSTRPEDLRDQRRRQLEIERNGVRAQLDLLATSHTRLETSIAQADAEAYRQSAAPVSTLSTAAPSINNSATTVGSTSVAIATERPRRGRKKKAKKARRLHHHQDSPPAYSGAV